MNQAPLARSIPPQFLPASRSTFSGSGLCSTRALGGDLQLLISRQASCRSCRASVATDREKNCLSETRFAMSNRVPTGIKMNSARDSSIRAIRRESISQAQRNAELEEEAKKIDLAPHKLLGKGEPGTMQGIIKDVIPVGYFVTLPSGRDGYLPALDLGFTGGIVILERLFKVGQELTVRVVRRGEGGREILSMKKPEFAPNTDPKFIFSERGGFGKGTNSTGNR